MPLATPVALTLFLPVDAAHAKLFDFEEFLDAVFRAFAADAAFLHDRPLRRTRSAGSAIGGPTCSIG
jgi:hypothetical protein